MDPLLGILVIKGSQNGSTRGLWGITGFSGFRAFGVDPLMGVPIKYPLAV